MAAVPKGFSCPSHPSCCLLVRFPIQRKCFLISPITSIFCLGHLSGVLAFKDPLVSQGCSAFKDLLVSPFKAPGTANTSPHCLPGSYFPTALMRPSCAHTVAYCMRLAPHPLSHCCGPHTKNLLNFGPVEGDSSPCVQPVLLF